MLLSFTHRHDVSNTYWFSFLENKCINRLGDEEYIIFHMIKVTENVEIFLLRCHILMDFHWELRVRKKNWNAFMILLWCFFVFYFILFLVFTYSLRETCSQTSLSFYLTARSKALKILALFQQKKHLVHALLYIHFHASIICSFSSILQLYYCIITVWLVLFHDCDSLFEIKGTNFSLL